MADTVTPRPIRPKGLGAWAVKPGGAAKVRDKDASSTAKAPGDQEATEAATEKLKERLDELQERLFVEQKRSVLVVLQAMDAGGKDGTISHVFSGVNPAGVRVAAFKAPSPEELRHDYLWRIHQQAPGHGEIVVFNRSHYEDVLVVRIHDLVPEDVWKARYEQIRAFEEVLTASGTVVVKLFLHISKDEQKARLQERLDDPTKRWKFNKGDLGERARWDDYQEAFSDALSKTSTEDSPWYKVPSDHKWYRTWVVLKILVETLEAMDPQLPPPDPTLDGLVIE